MGGPIKITLGRRPPAVRQAFPDALNALLSQYPRHLLGDIMAALFSAACTIVWRGHKTGPEGELEARAHMHAIVDVWCNAEGLAQPAPAPDPANDEERKRAADLARPRIILP